MLAVRFELTPIAGPGCTTRMKRARALEIRKNELIVSLESGALDRSAKQAKHCSSNDAICHTQTSAVLVTIRKNFVAL